MYLCWFVTKSLHGTLEPDLQTFFKQNYCLYKDKCCFLFFFFVGQRGHFQTLEIYLALGRKFQVRHYQQIPAFIIYKMQSNRPLLVP